MLPILCAQHVQALCQLLFYSSKALHWGLAGYVLISCCCICMQLFQLPIGNWNTHMHLS